MCSFDLGKLGLSDPAGENNQTLISLVVLKRIVCFQRNECNRKKIRRPSFFNQWIDLKEIYIEKGTFRDQFTFGDALVQSNIDFVGRPHSGLDDARNTATLAWKMNKEGSFLRITKDLNASYEMNRSF